MTLRVTFNYRDPTEEFDRKGMIDIKVPGTKVTAKMAMYVAKNFLETFENRTPTAALSSASCSAKDTGQQVFDIKFHVKAPTSIGSTKTE